MGSCAVHLTQGKELKGMKGGAGGFGCDVRMLINEARGIVDFVVDDDIEVFFRRVARYFGVGEFFCRRHLERDWCKSGEA